MSNEKPQDEIQEEMVKFMDLYGKDLIAQVVNKKVEEAMEEQTAKVEADVKERPLPLVDFKSGSVALVCTMAKDNIPIMFEFMSVEEARKEAKRVFDSF